MCCYGNMLDHGCASLVFLWSSVIVYPCDIHKVSKLLTGKKGQLEKRSSVRHMMTNFGFGPQLLIFLKLYLVDPYLTRLFFFVFVLFLFFCSISYQGGGALQPH